MEGPVRSRIDDGLAWIEIHRPEKLNALDRETLTALLEAVRAASADPGTRVILLTGAGDRAFAAGADIAEMDAQDREGIRTLMDLGKAVAHALEESPRPTIAVVNGYALGGGCELALACDLIFAAETAQFGLPEVDLAVVTGWGGSQRVERRVGYGRARALLFSGERIPAAQALAWGLCEWVVPLAALREEARACARRLAGKDPAALAAAKLALRRAELPLAEGLRAETDLFVELFDRPERRSAMAGFRRR